MINHPHTVVRLIEQLREVQNDLAATLVGIAVEKLDDRSNKIWSALDYLKHLILSVKPVSKALTLPREQLETMFGLSDHPSRTYEALVEAYSSRIAEGVKAEDYDQVTPAFYRIPEGTENVKMYLLEVWDKTHQQLFHALENWQEEDLDRYQLPHPAIGLLTVREMLFFTLHHNTLHWNDIRQTLA